VEHAVRLYFHPLSGHSHRVRLFLSLIGEKAELVEVDLGKGEHKSDAFLKLNPLGQIPVLDDDGVAIADSTAILVYLAKKFALTDWYPPDPLGASKVQRWLSVASGEIAYGLNAARLITLFGRKYDADEVIARAHAILAVIDGELKRREWIATESPTIADVALYSYIDRAPEGNVDRSPYVNVTRWLTRVEALAGFVPFQKSPVGLPDYR
jgi:glutathione S-transferase